MHCLWKILQTQLAVAVAVKRALFKTIVRDCPWNAIMSKDVAQFHVRAVPVMLIQLHSIDISLLRVDS